MARVVYVERSGLRHVVDLPEGKSIMRGAVENNIKGIVATCGGECACATCHVYVDEQYLSRLPAPNANEQELLTCVADEQKSNSRLSCQISMTAELDGIVVHLPIIQT